VAISREAVREFLGRDFDDWRWIKKVPRADLEAEVAALRVRPAFRTRPWDHQLACFLIGLSAPEMLYLLDMGAGKTKIIADLFTQRLREGNARRALVGVPRLINIDSWEEDLDRHSDLHSLLVNCEDIEEKRERLLNPGKAEIVVSDYQGLHWALSRKVKGKRGPKLERDDKLVRRAQKLYDFVAADEIHKLSNKDNLQHGIVNQLMSAARYRYGATGTLFGRDVQALWAAFRLVDRGETFGPNLGIFRAAFFREEMNAWKGTTYVFDKTKDRALNRMIQHRSIRYEEAEISDLPKRVHLKHVVDMSAEQRSHYDRALEGLINAGGQLAELDAAWLRMRQIASGYLAWKDGAGDHVVRFKDNPKLDWLESKIDEMGDSKVVVCHDYTETGAMICERLKARGIGHARYYGGTRDKSATRRRFLDDPACRVLVMNSESGGTGNDGLQRVARYMIFYETPTPPITRKQTEKRIHRPGQERRSFIWDVIADRSLDAGILAQIREGVDIHSRVVNGRPPSKKFFLTDAPRD
jgi:SNF2 family DNA or RNA helicase